jgi:basic membrane lipoprotein Med (substrate-binding protein (PBP1-ABC) superfamily)
MRIAILGSIVIVLVIIAAIASLYIMGRGAPPLQPGETRAETKATQPTYKSIRCAVIYVTPIDEPWNQAMHEAMTWARDNLGITYSYVERVSEADVERVIRQYIQAGYDIIIPHSWGYHQTTIKVAREYPNVSFAQGSGPTDIEYPRNVLVYDYWIHEAAYLAGVAAGKLTKRNLIGVVAAYSVPDVVRLINAFASGARSVNPSVKIRAIFIESWFDPVKAKEAAKALIASGADVIYGDSYGTDQAVEEAYRSGREVYFFATIIDYSRLAPNTLVASIVWDLRPFIKYLVGLKINGTWVSGILNWGIKEGWARLEWNPSFVNKNQALVAEVERIRRDIVEGRVSVPIMEDWDPKRWG